MSNQPDNEEKGRPERKTGERHHGVGRAGLSQSDPVLPSEVKGHQSVSAQGKENVGRSLRRIGETMPSTTVQPGQGHRGDVMR